MNRLSKLQWKILFTSVCIVALLSTAVVSAYWEYEFETEAGSFTIGKHYENGYLYFTLESPVEYDKEDGIYMFLDFTPSDEETDGLVTIVQLNWFYTDTSGASQPSWMTVTNSSKTLSIGIAVNKNGSPLGSEAFYSFAISGGVDGELLVYPESLGESFDETDSSEFEKEAIIPQNMIPELPLGTVSALMLMFVAFLWYTRVKS